MVGSWIYFTFSTVQNRWSKEAKSFSERFKLAERKDTVNWFYEWYDISAERIPCIYILKIELKFLKSPCQVTCHSRTKNETNRAWIKFFLTKGTRFCERRSTAPLLPFFVSPPSPSTSVFVRPSLRFHGKMTAFTSVVENGASSPLSAE